MVLRKSLLSCGCWTNTKEAFQSQFTLKYEVITLATSQYQYPVLQQLHQVMNPLFPVQPAHSLACGNPSPYFQQLAGSSGRSGGWNSGSTMVGLHVFARESEEMNFPTLAFCLFLTRCCLLRAPAGLKYLTRTNLSK